MGGVELRADRIQLRPQPGQHIALVFQFRLQLDFAYFDIRQFREEAAELMGITEKLPSEENEESAALEQAT